MTYEAVGVGMQSDPCLQSQIGQDVYLGRRKRCRLRPLWCCLWLSARDHGIAAKSPKGSRQPDGDLIPSPGCFVAVRLCRLVGCRISPGSCIVECVN
jgi:hypothetical protein